MVQGPSVGSLGRWWCLSLRQEPGAALETLRASTWQVVYGHPSHRTLRKEAWVACTDGNRGGHEDAEQEDTDAGPNRVGQSCVPVEEEGSF